MRREFVLRAATPADAAAIARLFRRSFHAALPHIATLHSPIEDERFFGTVVNSRHVELAIDPATGELLGFIAFDAGSVDHLYVNPDALRSGVGSTLLDVAKGSNAQLQLWTFQANTNARAFYQSQGFREIAVTDGKRNEEREPDVLLEWLRP